jgi:hypothetical protein
MTEFQIKQEDKQIIEYTRYVLSLENINDDSTMIFLHTKSFGILTPSIILDWIAKGVIVVIPNETKNVA